MSLSRVQPEVPWDIFSLAIDIPDLTYHLRCEELWDEVLNEMLDGTFTNRQHHNSSTYDSGCRGILCRKANRDHPRRKPTHDQSHLYTREERIFDPVLEYFHVVAKHRVKIARMELLQELKENA